MSQTQQDPTAESFRHALGCFPTGVAVITTTDAQGRPVGLTCNSSSSVSLEPPLVLWSLRHDSKSIDIFRRTEQFAINVLSVAMSTRRPATQAMKQLFRCIREDVSRLLETKVWQEREPFADAETPSESRSR